MSFTRQPNVSELMPEITFTTSRSSGPGGQNVNKVNTKVILHFNVRNSKILSEEQREVVLKKLASRITLEGVLQLQVQDSRSQLDNKENAVAKLELLMEQAFKIVKKRKATKPSKAARTKRLESKKKHSEKKQWRNKL